MLDHWGNGKDSIDLTKHWSKVLYENACAWKRDTFDWCQDNNDLTSMEWLKELIKNSYNVNLVEHIDEKFGASLHYEQGGITCCEPYNCTLDRCMRTRYVCTIVCVRQ